LKNNRFLRFVALGMVIAALGAGSLSYAQDTAARDPKLSYEDAPAVDGQAQSTGTTSSHTSTAADDGWHFIVAPYLWLPWTYGTVGALDREVHFYADPALYGEGPSSFCRCFTPHIRSSLQHLDQFVRCLEAAGPQFRSDH